MPVIKTYIIGEGSEIHLCPFFNLYGLEATDLEAKLCFRFVAFEERIPAKPYLIDYPQLLDA